MRTVVARPWSTPRRPSCALQPSPPPAHARPTSCGGGGAAARLATRRSSHLGQTSSGPRAPTLCNDCGARGTDNLARRTMAKGHMRDRAAMRNVPVETWPSRGALLGPNSPCEASSRRNDTPLRRAHNSESESIGEAEVGTGHHRRILRTRVCARRERERDPSAPDAIRARRPIAEEPELDQRYRTCQRCDVSTWNQPRRCLLGQYV